MPKGRKGRSGCTAWLLPILVAEHRAPRLSLGSVATVLFGRELSQARQSLSDHRHGTRDLPSLLFR